MLIALIVVISVGFGFVTWLNERNLDDITMRGTVVVDEQCGLDRALAINNRTVMLSNGRTTPAGCEYTFITTVKDRDTYTFKTRGQDALTTHRSLIDTAGSNGDTELMVRLSW